MNHPFRPSLNLALLWPVAALAIITVAGLSVPLRAGAVAHALAGPGDADPDNWTQYHRTSNACR